METEKADKSIKAAPSPKKNDAKKEKAEHSRKKHHRESDKKHSHKHKSKHKKHHDCHHKHKKSEHRSRTKGERESGRIREKDCCFEQNGMKDKEENELIDKSLSNSTRNKSSIRHDQLRMQSEHMHSKNSKHAKISKKKKHKHGRHHKSHGKSSSRRKKDETSEIDEKKKHHKHCHHNKSRKKKHSKKHHSKASSKSQEKTKSSNRSDKTRKLSGSKSSRPDEKTPRSKISEEKKRIELVPKAPKLKDNLTPQFTAATDATTTNSATLYERPRHSLSAKLTREKIFQKIQEDYENFHRDHPGFFQLAVSTKDMCQCFARVRRIVETHLKSQRSSHERKQNSHIQSMTESEKKFLQSRIQQFRQCTVAWTTGCDKPGLDKKSPALNLGSSFCSDLLFRQKQCPRNILTSSLPSQSIQTEKMRALIQLRDREQGLKERCSQLKLPQL